MRALIDTCVIVDALQNREPFCKDAQDLFLAAASDLFVGCITAKASTDIYYLMHRYTHNEVADTAGIDCRRAIPSPVSDFEDAVMIETAARTEVDCIVTRNIQDFAKSTVPVLTPKDFLRKLADD